MSSVLEVLPSAVVAEKPAAKKAKVGTTTMKKKNKGTGSSHPATSEMVCAAIRDLKERGGSSLQAIKKYVGGKYNVDVDKMGPFLKRYVKSAVAKGTLVQTKGKGASGSFKLVATAAGPKKVATKKPKKSPSKKKVVTKKKEVSTPKKKSSPAKTKKNAAAGKKKKVTATKKKQPVSASKKTAVATKSPGKEKKAKAAKKVAKSPKPKKATASGKK